MRLKPWHIIILLALLTACTSPAASPAAPVPVDSPASTNPPPAAPAPSTTPAPGAVSTLDPISASSYENSNSSVYLSTGAALAVGYADFNRDDFNRDGLEDVLMAYISGTRDTVPLKMYLGNAAGQFTQDNSLLPSPPPGTVHARKIIVADFNRDGVPDAFIADHGYDSRPFPGARPVLLLSVEGHFETAELPGVPAGFQHSATAADINGDGSPDIFVTDTTNSAFLLLNDGQGNFTLTRRGLPPITGGYFTSEFIDLDEDGYYDLLVGGHEQDGAVTRVYWGDSTGTFSTTRASDIPGDPDYRIVLDFDAADLDGDGTSELVLTRTKSTPFYKGFYFQMLDLSRRQFADVSTRIVPDRLTWEGATRPWVAWTILRDLNRDGFPDLEVADRARGIIYLNEGTGVFTKAP